MNESDSPATLPPLGRPGFMRLYDRLLYAFDQVISLIVTFQYFTQAYVLTNGRGDPNNATLFINLDLFREAFQFNQMGYGAAIAWMLFVIVLILTLALFAFARKRVYYAGGQG